MTSSAIRRGTHARGAAAGIEPIQVEAGTAAYAQASISPAHVEAGVLAYG
jgi:hypothetical protein